MGRLNSRAVVRVSPTDAGEDAAAFVQGLLTNDVTGDLPAYAALLSAQGKTMFDMIVWRDGNSLLLDCEADQAEALAKRLSLYRLRRKLEITVDPLLGVFWSLDPVDGYTPDPRHPALGFRRVAEYLDGDRSRGRTIPCPSPFARCRGRAWRNWATCCGSKPMPPNSTASASPRAATSARKTPRG